MPSFRSGSSTFMYASRKLGDLATWDSLGGQMLIAAICLILLSFSIVVSNRKGARASSQLWATVSRLVRRGYSEPSVTTSNQSKTKHHQEAEPEEAPEEAIIIHKGGDVAVPQLDTETPKQPEDQVRSDSAHTICSCQSFCSCVVHQKYDMKLLMAHRALSLRISRGAPGLERDLNLADASNRDLPAPLKAMNVPKSRRSSGRHGARHQAQPEACC
jgi:hypothetical protein